MQKSKAELKEIFVSGAKPLAQDFHDWMDSYMHKEDLTAALERLERISIEGDLAWQVDGELDEGSDNPVKNSAVTEAVKALQEAIDGNGASLEEVSGQIDELLGTIAGKASASTVTALQTALAALQTTVSGKASGSELAALGDTVTALGGRMGTAETAIAGKMSVQQGSANAGKVPMVGADGNLVLTDEVGAVKSVSVNGGEAVEPDENGNIDLTMEAGGSLDGIQLNGEDVTPDEETGKVNIVAVEEIVVGGQTLTNNGGRVTVPVPTVEQSYTSESDNPPSCAAIEAEFGGLRSGQVANIEVTTEEGLNKITLRDSEDNVIAESNTFSGGGGGGAAASRIKLTRVTQNTTIKSGSAFALQFKFQHLNADDEDLGTAGVARLMITHGATVSTVERNVSSSSTTVTMAGLEQYLGVGDNVLKLVVTVDDEGTTLSSQMTWRITVAELRLLSGYNLATATERGSVLRVPYELNGAGSKTLRCYVDGEDLYDVSQTTSSGSGQIAIDTDELEHGSHSIVLRAELEVTGGSKIYSNTIYIDAVVKEAGETAPVVATRFDYDGEAVLTEEERPCAVATQFGSYTLRYAVYTPGGGSTTVTVKHNGTAVSSQSTSFVTKTLEVRVSENEGEYGGTIEAGGTTYTYGISVGATDMELNEHEESMQLKLDATGRSNSDTDRGEWTSGSVNCELAGFKWSGDGWTGTALRHSGAARTRVNFEPYRQPDNSTGATAVVVKYGTSDVTDEEAEIIRCVDGSGCGFVITPTEAKMTANGGSTVGMRMDSEEVYEVAFVSFPASDGESMVLQRHARMLYMFINGIMSGGVQMGANESVYQNVPAKIEIGAAGATTDLYTLRCYDTYLEPTDVLNLAIMDQGSTEAMLAMWERNDLYDGDTIDLEKVPDGMRVVIVTGATEGMTTLAKAASTNNKKTKFDVDSILTYVQGDSSCARNMVVKANETDGTVKPQISLQGTSSLAYPTKNYRLYTKTKKTTDGVTYRPLMKVGCDRLGAGGETVSSAKYAFKEGAAPVQCWCLKADYAESSSSHNTGMARIANDTLVAVGEKTPAQRHTDLTQYGYDVRTTVDGEPCLLFARETEQDNLVFMGKFNWNNDKSTEAVFGFCDIPGYHDQAWTQGALQTVAHQWNALHEDDEDYEAKGYFTECWEFRNNEMPMGSFLDDDFEATTEVDGEEALKWTQCFEIRFPDDDDITGDLESGAIKPYYLSKIVEWVKSTRNNATKFRNELQYYFDVDYLCDYYTLTDMFGCVDQRVKNMMMAIWYNPEATSHAVMGKFRAYMIFYDCDTILGVRNDGRLKYGWDIDENSVDAETGTYAYAGHDSVLWANLRSQFGAELKAAYQRLRAELTNAKMFEYFDTAQSDKFAERIYNEDAVQKYVNPKTLGVEVLEEGSVQTKRYDYVESMQGNRKSHRHWWWRNRMSTKDAWGGCGTFKTNGLQWKSVTTTAPTLSAEAARDTYFMVTADNATKQHSAAETGEAWEYTHETATAIGTTFNFYGTAWVKELDLSEWGGFTNMDLALMPKLERLVLGGETASTASSLAVGSNVPHLKELVMGSWTSLTYLDLSGCTLLESADLSGCVSLTSADFAAGAPIEDLTLPESLQVLKLAGLSELTDEGLELGEEDNLTGLWIENCAQLDGLALLEELVGSTESRLERVRLDVGTQHTAPTLLQSIVAKGVNKGWRADGSQCNYCALYGVWELPSYVDDAVHEALSEAFPELDIRQPEYTIIEFDDEVSDPANISNLDNGTGYKYGTDYEASGHIEKILSQRHRCLAKVTAAGVMTYYPLHDKNSTFYADAKETNNCTTAKLDGTEGDVMMYEPHYWYKGINDRQNGKKYSCFSSREEMPETPAATVLTWAELQAAGLVQNNYKVQAGKSTLSAAKSSDSSYALVRVAVGGYGRVRFPSVPGSGLVGSVFVDDGGDIVDDVLVETLSGGFEAGMYVIADVPSGATDLYFTVLKSAEFDKVVLSNSSKIEDMEPDWVEHEACMVAVAESTIVGTKLRSVMTSAASANNLSWTDFNYYSAARGMQQIDYEMHKDIANLFYAKYGTRDSQGQCGYGDSSNSQPQNRTAALGMKDTVNPNGATTGSWYWSDDEVPVLTSCGSVNALGYQNLFGDKSECMDGVAVNVGQVDGKYVIDMPDGTQRKVKSKTTSGEYIRAVAHGKYMDVIAVAASAGTSTTYYCDINYYTASVGRVVHRSHNGAFAYGGVSYAYALNDASNSSATIGSRLAFRGTLVKAASVVAYKAATEVS